MENKVRFWLAREEKGSLWAYSGVPFKDDDGMWFSDKPQYEINSSKFPSVKWEDDEPTEAYITLTAPKEIDWEQRMAEIAESIFVTEQPYINCEEEVEKYAEIAIQRAKILINKLKKESDA